MLILCIQLLFIVGAERLEETSFSALFAYGLQDRFRITAILGSHLLTLGIGAALLFAKALVVVET